MKEMDDCSDIKGLRAVVVLSVVLPNLSSGVNSSGYVGVDVFFVISEYLITSIIRREMAEGRLSFLRLCVRRTRRVFPALFTALAPTMIASYWILVASGLSATLGGALGTLFLSSNIVSWRDFEDGYLAATDASWNSRPHTRSLSVVEHLNLLFRVPPLLR